MKGIHGTRGHLSVSVPAYIPVHSWPYLALSGIERRRRPSYGYSSSSGSDLVGDSASNPYLV